MRPHFVRSINFMILIYYLKTQKFNEMRKLNYYSL